MFTWHVALVLVESVGVAKLTYLQIGVLPLHTEFEPLPEVVPQRQEPPPNGSAMA